MNRTYIKDLTEGQVKIKGMVETIRDKKIMFLIKCICISYKV